MSSVSGGKIYPHTNIVHWFMTRYVPFNWFDLLFDEKQDTSKNGTYFHAHRSSAVGVMSLEPIDAKLKRRILAHKDRIYIERKPTICFEFHSFHLEKNCLPADINETYHIGNELGNGACGTVYFVQNRKTCQAFALKFTTSDRNGNSVATILKEVDIMRQLQHPCVLKLFKTQTYSDSVAIFIDFMTGGDLLCRINKLGHFTESYTKFVFYQICCGIEYLHQKKITHRDLKPENILLATTDRYTSVKVSDFGLSKRITSSVYMQTQCGTIAYLAPEISTSKYTDKVDIWSLGVVLYNCFTGRYPYEDPGCKEYKMYFRHDEFQQVSNAGKNIVYETLQFDPKNRPSITHLLTEREWLAKSDVSVQKAHQVMDTSINSNNNI